MRLLQLFYAASDSEVGVATSPCQVVPTSLGGSKGWLSLLMAASGMGARYIIGLPKKTRSSGLIKLKPTGNVIRESGNSCVGRVGRSCGFGNARLQEPAR
jgi:hypothetical protein